MNKDFLSILTCPKCNGKLRKLGNGLVCEDCGKKYEEEGNVLVLE